MRTGALAPPDAYKHCFRVLHYDSRFDPDAFFHASGRRTRVNYDGRGYTIDGTSNFELMV